MNWFTPIYETAPGDVVTSRSRVTWQSVSRSRSLLEKSGVAAVVAPHPPPVPQFGIVERIGDVRVAWLHPRPLVDSIAGSPIIVAREGHGEVALSIDAKTPDHIMFRQTWDPGWVAYVDGIRAQIQPENDMFIGMNINSGKHNVILKYDPPEVRAGLFLSFAGAAFLILVLTRIRLF